ncbi:hypothetical protein BST81_04230 [Leptolyngbya sp. 'hensonii']|uniref:hypothetical protein n=1 Tax=Leptolyngbya sp. 'hensonii' TaxID=1922337 RepID=UPI00094F4BD7|nr:hypothetical protein [Leptolyngbya sp. 'hensonii']OLP19748.1 hypothetical protein BST81_04230 [Leptolyngbya sp. 'hensonii']
MAGLAISELRTVRQTPVQALAQDTETLLINEHLVSQFKFWMDGQIQSGMRYRHLFFRLVHQFDNNQRHHAFELAWQVALPGEQVVITTTGKQYKIWAELKSIHG